MSNHFETHVKIDTPSKIRLELIKENKELIEIINKQIEYLYDDIIYPFDKVDEKRHRKFNVIQEKDLVKKMTMLIIQQSKLLGIL